MNAEKVNAEAVPIKVQQSKKGLSAVSMIDNRELSTMQAKMTEIVQRMGDEDEELLQGKFVVQREEEDDELLQGKFEQPAQRQIENRTGIPDDVIQNMEDSFGADFSSVRVHPESSKAPEVGALAYTQGTDIHFAPDNSDRILLADSNCWVMNWLMWFNRRRDAYNQRPK